MRAALPPPGYPAVMDRNDAPKEQRARAGMGRVALIVIVTIVALFAVYNLYYALTP